VGSVLVNHVVRMSGRCVVGYVKRSAGVLASGTARLNWYACAALDVPYTPLFLFALGKTVTYLFCRFMLPTKRLSVRRFWVNVLVVMIDWLSVSLPFAFSSPSSSHAPRESIASTSFFAS
jgi:hypothetical protein